MVEEEKVEQDEFLAYPNNLAIVASEVVAAADESDIE